MCKKQERLGQPIKYLDTKCKITEIQKYEEETIMPKMMKEGGVVDMTRSIIINPETGE